MAAIEQRNADRDRRINQRRAELPDDVEALRMLSEAATDPEEAIAANTNLIRQAPEDVAALNRLGRALEAIGRVDDAKQTFRDVLGRNPTNPIALRHLRELERVHP